MVRGTIMVGGARDCRTGGVATIRIAYFGASSESRIGGFKIFIESFSSFS